MLVCVVLSVVLVACSSNATTMVSICDPPEQLDCANADLSGADLTSANLTGANLSGANLTNANLSGANLTNANLSGANLSGAKLTYFILSNTDLSGAYLLRANLSGAFLFGADLSEANLAYANLQTAYLYEANLSGANLTNANLSVADLTSADLRRTILSAADLSFANLTNANLTSADLSEANLYEANLSGANLTNANLTNANLETARNWAGFPDTVVESTTTTIVTEGKLVDSAAGMICVPGSCTGNSRDRDSKYLKDVQTNVPRSYYDNISDGQIFKMAYYWCNLLEQNQWTTIEELFDNIYKRGNRNEQLLSVWTLASSVMHYCIYTHNEKVGNFLGSLRYL